MILPIISWKQLVLSEGFEITKIEVSLSLIFLKIKMNNIK
jgi:hypothetical protein